VDPMRKAIHSINIFNNKVLGSLQYFADEINNYPMVHTGKINFALDECFSIKTMKNGHKTITLAQNQKSINWIIGKMLESFGESITDAQKNALVICLVLSVEDYSMNADAEAINSQLIMKIILLEAKNFAYGLALNGNREKEKCLRIC